MKFVASLLLVQLGVALAIECPDLWTTFRGSCYLFAVNTNLSFVEAEHYCGQNGGHLVDVESAAENLFIKDYLRNNKRGTSWMGLTDMGVEGLWVWYDTKAAATFTDWLQGEPNDAAHIEDCGVFYAFGDADYTWNDVPCLDRWDPVCEIRRETDVIG